MADVTKSVYLEYTPPLAIKDQVRKMGPHVNSLWETHFKFGPCAKSTARSHDRSLASLRCSPAYNNWKLVAYSLRV